jgi:molecular chaperone GrpE
LISPPGTRYPAHPDICLTNEEAMTDQTGAKPEEQTASPEPATAPPDARTEAADTAKLQAEIADLKDRLLRTLAELENVRRRSAREVQDERTYAVTSFAREILGIGDNLQRTIEALPKEGAEAESPVVKSLVEGVAVTAREFLKVLGKFKIRRLEPLGERFDPNFHQAMYEVPSADVASGTILEVMQAGYAIGDRVLRPALVAVAKGGPRTAPTTPPPHEAEPEPPAA